MSIIRSEIRIDCRNFAKCGVKSLSHCRRYRGEDAGCRGCTLIHRKPRNHMYDSSGSEMKMCTRCGNYFYLNRFYGRFVNRNGKIYHSLSSWCRMCLSEVNNKRNSKNKKQWVFQ
ncbi:hypothetical protein E7X19_02035 [Bacteroides fragilis]|nr:hypothetical protein E7X03_05510 [Bacteroides fragilis]THC76681.1 hypothetical protein E7X19_02035 [Bacteroides fragilis]THC84863.1 hypothetical protein E7X23_11665 [Bacteroides fragilis]